MSYNRNSRRDFLRKLTYVAAGGGTAAMIPQLRMMGTALANTSALTGYKALVCIYLSGGNDGWNMLVPYDNARYNVYATARSGVYSTSGSNQNPGGLALVQPASTDTTHIITDGNDQNSSTNKYFVNNSSNNPMNQLAALYQQNHLAFAVNVGTLTKPITKAQYNSSTAPPQLFSHSDQENLWHQANTSTSSNLGWGGRCGDVVGSSNTNQALSSCISIAGASRFEIGMSTVPYQLSSGGLTGLSSVCNPSPCTGVSNNSIRDNALKGMLDDTYASDFSNEYAKVFARGRDLYNDLSSALAATTLKTSFPTTGNGLASQLQMVAKMIKLSKTSNLAQRQIYYVRTGGFDLHAGMMSGNGNHSQLLKGLNDAMNAFNTAMGAGDVNADAVTFTASEFARTLQSNGSGSDHAWGSVHMVMGNSVNGGKLYSDGGGPITGFPNQALDATNNFSRGQMVPGIGVEQYAATMAQWLGVTNASDLNTIFPNLHNFSKTNLGFV